MNEITIFNVKVSSYVYAPLAYFIWVMFFLIIKRVIFDRIRKFTSKTKTKVDDVVLHSFNFPLTLLIFVSGVFLLKSAVISSQNTELTKYFFAAFRIATMVAVIIIFDRLLRGLIQIYSQRVEVLRTSAGIAQGVVRAIVIILGILIILDSLGVSITPLIASLGVGSLAVALALQPTLENFFSGIQLVIDKPIKVGQFVKLESGEEGYVHKIGWRSSWIRMLPNNTVVIPNKSLVSSKVLNYYYPEKEMAVLVQVGVHYDSDLEHVEKVTIEVGREILKKVQGGVPEFDPFIRYHTFNNFSIDFTVILRCKEFVDNYLIKHEFIKLLHKRYAKEGIVIPYPINAINYTQEKAQK